VLIMIHSNRGDTSLEGLRALLSTLCLDTGLINPRERTLILIPAPMAHQSLPPHRYPVVKTSGFAVLRRWNKNTTGSENERTHLKPIIV